MTDSTDLLHYMNGKALQSPWRKKIAAQIIEAEESIEMYCNGTHRRVLEMALERMNQGLRSPTLKHGKFRMSLGDPWTCIVKERVAAIQTRVDLLVASGQL